DGDETAAGAVPPPMSPYARGAEDGTSPYARGAEGDIAPQTRGAGDATSPYARGAEDATSPYARGAEDVTSPYARGAEEPGATVPWARRTPKSNTKPDGDASVVCRDVIRSYRISADDTVHALKGVDLALYPGTSPRSSVRPAQASPRCCGCSPVWTVPT